MARRRTHLVGRTRIRRIAIPSQRSRSTVTTRSFNTREAKASGVAPIAVSELTDSHIRYNKTEARPPTPAAWNYRRAEVGVRGQEVGRPAELAQLRGVGEEPSHRGLDPTTRERTDNTDVVDDHRGPLDHLIHLLARPCQSELLAITV
jgi:hypothetical protein